MGNIGIPIRRHQVIPLEHPVDPTWEPEPTTEPLPKSLPEPMEQPEPSTVP